MGIKLKQKKTFYVKSTNENRKKIGDLAIKYDISVRKIYSDFDIHISAPSYSFAGQEPTGYIITIPNGKLMGYRLDSYKDLNEFVHSILIAKDLFKTNEGKLFLKELIDEFSNTGGVWVLD